MPFYEYECSACKFYVEALQKISDPPMKQCPSCKKQTLKRLVSAPVFRLKGGGWYETDFKSEQERKRNLLKDEAESAGESSATETKTEAADAKPEAKAEKAKPVAVSAKKPAAKSKPAAKPKPKAKPKPAAKKK